jgi:hypothetical protein
MTYADILMFLLVVETKSCSQILLLCYVQTCHDKVVHFPPYPQL